MSYSHADKYVSLLFLHGRWLLLLIDAILFYSLSQLTQIQLQDSSQGSSLGSCHQSLRDGTGGELSLHPCYPLTTYNQKANLM